MSVDFSVAPQTIFGNRVRSIAKVGHTLSHEEVIDLLWAAQAVDRFAQISRNSIPKKPAAETPTNDLPPGNWLLFHGEPAFGKAK